LASVSLLPFISEYRQEYYNNYLLANGHFLAVILRHARPGDTVWIHNYYLMPLSQKIRQRKPETSIGIF
jgi:trehalose 6-phosphate synthase/phosphatase